MTNTPDKSEMKALRYIAVTPTPEQREAAHDFYSANGDCVLIWANQGDLDLIEFPPPSRPPADQVPDMMFAPDAADLIQQQRAEIERLSALVEESLYHLRLDEAAKAYHERALTALGKDASDE